MNVSMQAENFRRMLLTLHDDIRVIIIKIADRLHNMQTIQSMSEDKQLKIASETLYIYAPLAHKIGLYNIKTELEDLSLKYTEPNIYNDIINKLEESKEEQDLYIKNISKVLKKALNKEQLKTEIKGRPKSIYSIRRKIRDQGVSFDEVYDKFAVRIIYKSELKNEKFLAWKIYSIVTDYFRPNPIRLRDWISAPKSTGYEALHITVMGPKGRWVEVQIRSERMNEIADQNGFAVCYPQGRRVGGNGDTHWNARLSLSTIDDVGFLSSLAQFLQSEHNLNPNKTFSCGMSNGGYMSYTLACEAPNVFKAIASITGTMSGESWDTLNMSAAVIPATPILHIHGTQDDIVPIDGTMNEEGGWGGAPAVDSIISFWAAQHNTTSIDTLFFPQSTNAYHYHSGLDSNKVWYYKIDGMGHEWPEPSTLYGIVASEVVWDFFSKQ